MPGAALTERAMRSHFVISLLMSSRGSSTSSSSTNSTRFALTRARISCRLQLGSLSFRALDAILTSALPLLVGALRLRRPPLWFVSVLREGGGGPCDSPTGIAVSVQQTHSYGSFATYHCITILTDFPIGGVSLLYRITKEMSSQTSTGQQR
jgi:hypothetical protein